jgi:hypothetical protein
MELINVVIALTLCQRIWKPWVNVRFPISVLVGITHGVVVGTGDNAMEPRAQHPFRWVCVHPVQR